MQISLAHAAKAFFVLIHGRFGRTLCVFVVREQVMSVWLFVLGFLSAFANLTACKLYGQWFGVGVLRISVRMK